jgi:pilus assembly protein CpaF
VYSVVGEPDERLRFQDRTFRSMFAIVISEKGGAERREVFDKHEINVGRVQGNDLMLPKGNVSKRHARLLFRDGRIIVTDLKSTNGTYVNGRKIAQATIVREGDKIYVGDFVLRIEMSGSTPSPRLAGGGAPLTSTAPSPSFPAAPPPRPSVNFEGEFTARHDISAAPISDSADASTGRHMPEMPEAMGAARAPASTDAQLGVATGRPSSADGPSVPHVRPSQAAPVPALVARAGSSQPSSPRAARRVTSRLMALAGLVERVAEAIDLTPLTRGAEPDQVLAHRIERLVREKAKSLREEGQVPSGVEVDDTIRDAQRELLGLGAIEPLLEDEDISEIRVFGHTSVTAVRGAELIEIDPAYSSEAALLRAIVRLCRQSSQPLGAGETLAERYLHQRGLLLQAVLPPTSQYGNALVIKKRRHAEAALDDLVRSGTVSRAMATFLRGCATARANLLLIGPSDGTAQLLSALASAGQPTDRIVALQAIDELWGLEPEPVSMRLTDSPEEAVKLVRAAAKLHPDRLVINPMSGPAAAAMVGTIAEGCEGVLAAISAPSIRHALERLVCDLMASRPGLTLEAARSWLFGSFELAVEIARLRDGRHRVMRIAELVATEDGVAGRDVFTFVVERTAVGGAVEGSFIATGVVPRIAEDLAARGGPLDSAVFRRDRG